MTDCGEPIHLTTKSAIFCSPVGLRIAAVYTGRMGLTGNVHLVPGNTKAIESITALLKEEGIETTGNPDLYIRTYASFGVDEARDISLKANSRAVGPTRRVFVLVTPSMTNESQNALLKTLEEPSGDALFFIVVPSPQQLLPTLRSRSQILQLENVVQGSAIDTGDFLKAKPEKRVEMLKPLLEKDDDDKRDISAAIIFLSALEEQLSEDVRKNEEGLQAVYRARKYLGDKGSLTKALLEQVALLI
jgi:DNA polymerase III delta prime subunit